MSRITNKIAVSIVTIVVIITIVVFSPHVYICMNTCMGIHVRMCVPAPIDDALKTKAAAYRTELIEIAVEQDEGALLAYLEGVEPR